MTNTTPKHPSKKPDIFDGLDWYLTNEHEEEEEEEGGGGSAPSAGRQVDIDVANAQTAAQGLPPLDWWKTKEFREAQMDCIRLSMPERQNKIKQVALARALKAKYLADLFFVAKFIASILDMYLPHEFKHALDVVRSEIVKIKDKDARFLRIWNFMNNPTNGVSHDISRDKYANDVHTYHNDWMHKNEIPDDTETSEVATFVWYSLNGDTNIFTNP